MFLKRTSTDDDDDKLDFSKPFSLSKPVGMSSDNKRRDVAKVESLLGKTKHLNLAQTDGPTGYFGERLNQAVQRFQKDNKLKTDGVLNPGGETIRKLTSVLAPKVNPSANSRPSQSRPGTKKPSVNLLALTQEMADKAASQNKSGKPAPLVPGLKKQKKTPSGPLARGSYQVASNEWAPPPKGKDATIDMERREDASPQQASEKRQKPSADEKNNVGNAAKSSSRLERFSADAVEKLFRQGVKAGRGVGLDDAADNLDRYMKGTGGVKRYTREQARAMAPIRDAEKENMLRFINGTFIGETEDNEEPRKLKSMKDGETIQFKDHWDKQYKKSDNLGQAVTGDLDFVLGHGRTGVKSSGDFTATRKGDEITIQGTVEHGFNDDYDFTKGEYVGAARLLEKHKGAKPFNMRAGWKQRVRATVKVGPNNNLSVDKKSVKWEDMDE